MYVIYVNDKGEAEEKGGLGKGGIYIIYIYDRY